jgi:hypothetical protein
VYALQALNIDAEEREAIRDMVICRPINVRRACVSRRRRGGNEGAGSGGGGPSELMIAREAVRGQGGLRSEVGAVAGAGHVQVLRVLDMVLRRGAEHGLRQVHLGGRTSCSQVRRAATDGQ